jgi:hypothetical protein
MLFAAYRLLGQPMGGAPRKIVITAGQIDSLVTGFTKTWLRPPTSDELEDLIQDRVREEVYCREAVALGLDKDDAIIRRRLRQKLEFVSEDLADDVEPSDDDLRAYLKAHPETFRVEGRVPALEEVRDAVRGEWATAHRLEANETFYRGLLQRYSVNIERP